MNYVNEVITQLWPRKLKVDVLKVTDKWTGLVSVKTACFLFSSFHIIAVCTLLASFHWHINRKWST